MGRKRGRTRELESARGRGSMAQYGAASYVRGGRPCAWEGTRVAGQGRGRWRRDRRGAASTTRGPSAARGLDARVPGPRERTPAATEGCGGKRRRTCLSGTWVATCCRPPPSRLQLLGGAILEVRRLSAATADSRPARPARAGGASLMTAEGKERWKCRGRRGSHARRSRRWVRRRAPRLAAPTAFDLAFVSRRDPEPFDWYQRYSGIKDLVGQYVKKSDKVLMVGAGNSRACWIGAKGRGNAPFASWPRPTRAPCSPATGMTEEMYDDGMWISSQGSGGQEGCAGERERAGRVGESRGRRATSSRLAVPFVVVPPSSVRLGCAPGYSSIMNIDISKTVVDLMAERHRDKRGVGWAQMDVLALDFPDASYDAVVDKGTLDSILCGESSTANVAKMCANIARVLKATGVYFVVSYGIPENRLSYLENEAYGWTVTVHTVGACSRRVFLTLFFILFLVSKEDGEWSAWSVARTRACVLIGASLPSLSSVCISCVGFSGAFAAKPTVSAAATAAEVADASAVHYVYVCQKK